MSDVQFDDNRGGNGSVLYTRFQKVAQIPAMVGWLMKVGVAKTPKQAEGLLIGIFCICIILSIFFVHKSSSRPHINASNTNPYVQEALKHEQL